MARDVVRLGGVCLVAAAVGAGSWFVAAAVGGDSGARPTASEVRPSAVTVAVTRRVVVTAVSGRAAVGFTNLVDVEAPVGGGRVTGEPPAEGTEVQEGEVLAEIDGRPVVALQGTTPMYRPLAIGLSGPDVLQFEAALQRLGLDPGPVDGVFDEDTERAVRDFYPRVGYAAAEPTAEQRAAYEAARNALTQAQLKVLSDRDALDRDIRGPDPSVRAELDNGVATARDALAKAERDRSTLVATLDDEAARAADDVDRAGRAVSQVEDQIDALPPDAPAGERAGLAAQLDEARAALAAATRVADGLARGRPGRIADADAAVAAARRALDAVSLARSDALVSKNRALLVETLRVSEAAVADAQARLADQAVIVAAGVAAHEIVFVPDFPRRVQAVLAQRGDAAGGVVVRLSGGDPVGRWFVTAAERELLDVGMPVTLGEAGSGAQHRGSVLSIADEPGDPGAAAAGADPGAGAPQGGYLVELAVEPGPGGASAESLVGRDLQVTAPVEQSDGPQLAVPVAAVTSDPDGSAKVVVDAGDGRTREVRVTVGLVGGGYAEVRPAEGGALDEGDRVVVGA